MKITLSITELNGNAAEHIKRVASGTKLHYSVIGMGDGYIQELTISDDRDIDVNELIEVLNAMKIATWKVEGVGGDAL